MVLLRTVHLKGSLGNQKGPSMALLRKKTLLEPLFLWVKDSGSSYTA